MKKIRVLQIGLNYYSHAVQAWHTLQSLNDLFEIAGYVLPENERERYPDKLGMFDGYTELSLEDALADDSIDAVLIETDEIYLTKYALLAAKAGKAIHMEKPGGADEEEFKRLIAEVNRQGCLVHLGYMYRYNPCIADAVRRAREGALGRIISVEAQMSCIHSPDVQKWMKTLPGGMMFFLGCHLIDLIVQIQGLPQNITSYSKDEGRFCMAVLEYENGVSFARTCDTEVGGFDRRQLVITGEKGTIEIRPLEVLAQGGDCIYTEQTEYSSVSWHDRGLHSRTEEMHRYEGMLRAFGEMIQCRRSNPFTPDDEWRLYQTIMKCCGLAGEEKE